MRTNWKLLVGFSLFGAAVSLISGIAGGNPFAVIVLRLVLSAVVFGALGFAAQAVLRRYLPDLMRAAPRPARTDGGSVDIIIDEEVPASAAQAPPEAPESEGPVSETDVGGALGEQELFAEPETAVGEGLPADEFGSGELADFEEGVLAARSTGAAPERPSEPADSSARSGRQTGREGAGDLELLPEIDALEDAGGLGGGPEGPEPVESEPPVRTTPQTPREMRQAQIEEAVKDQDPEDLARAVRTFLKKDQ